MAMQTMSFVLMLSLVSRVLSVSCQFTLNEFDYDLSPLQSDTDYSGTGGDGSDFVFNLCGNAVTADCDGNTCQYDTSGNQLAMVSSWTNLDPDPVWALIDPLDPNAGVTLTSNNGDRCMLPRQLIVSFVCSAHTSSTLSFSETSACMYEMEFETPLVCTEGVPLSGGGIFLIILSVTTVVYLAGGFWYKHKYKGTNGVESVPNIDFWRRFPGYVAVGCKVTHTWVKSKLQGHEATKYDEL